MQTIIAQAENLVNYAANEFGSLDPATQLGVAIVGFIVFASVFLGHGGNYAKIR